MFSHTFVFPLNLLTLVTRRTPITSTGLFAKRTVLIWIVVLSAVAARVIILVISRNTFLWNGIWSDAATYNQWAQRIVSSNDWIGNDPFFMSPFYSYFLAVIYSLFGESLLAVRLVQAGAGSAMAGLVFLVGEKMFTRQAAFMAGLLAAVYGPFLLSSTLLLVETLKVFFLVFTLWLFLVAGKKSQWWWWILPGISLGFAVLCRPTDMLILIVAAIWIMILGDTDRSGKFRRLAVFTMGMFLIIAPVTIRNYLVSGDFILITSNGGLNFYLGNNPEAVGIYYNVDRLDLANDPDGRVFLETQEGRPVSAAEASSIWLSKAMSFVADQPISFISLLGKKLLLFFHHKEISQLGYNYVFVGQYALPLIKFLPSFIIIGPFGILGCMLAWRKWRSHFLLYGFLAVEIIGVLLFFMTDRFRLSAVPFLMLFAGFAVVEVVDQIRRRDWHTFRLAVAVVVIVCLVMTVLNIRIEDEFSLEWEQVGLMHLFAKNHRAALEAFQESGKYKDSFHLHNNIGNVHAAIGEMDLALNQFRMGEALNPDQPVSAFGMGTVLASRRNWDAALEAFDRSIRINPRFAPAHLNKGLVLYYMQRFEEALVEMRAYAELEPDKSKLASVYGDIRNLERLVEQRRDSTSSDQSIRAN